MLKINYFKEFRKILIVLCTVITTALTVSSTQTVDAKDSGELRLAAETVFILGFLEIKGHGNMPGNGPGKMYDDYQVRKDAAYIHQDRRYQYTDSAWQYNYWYITITRGGGIRNFLSNNRELAYYVDWGGSDSTRMQMRF